MPGKKNKLKTDVRERMAKTGECYCTARVHVLKSRVGDPKGNIPSGFDHESREFNVNVMFCGPKQCGKTTNIEAIYSRTPEMLKKGGLTGVGTKAISFGLIQDYRTWLYLSELPLDENLDEQSIQQRLSSVSGLVFVADTRTECFEKNLACLDSLREALEKAGHDLNTFPLVFQWNKRDLKAVTTVKKLEAVLNPMGFPCHRATATQGKGVFETIAAITAMVTKQLGG